MFMCQEREGEQGGEEKDYSRHTVHWFKTKKEKLEKTQKAMAKMAMDKTKYM